MIERAIEITAREEGFRPYAFDDANGEPIVPGYTMVGHVTWLHGLCLEKGHVPSLPPNLAQDTLEYVVNRGWLALTTRLPRLLTQPEDVQVALACMVYQLGVDGVLGFPLMLAALERGDRETAAANVISSRLHKQTPARAERVAALIRGAAA